MRTRGGRSERTGALIGTLNTLNKLFLYMVAKPSLKASTKGIKISLVTPILESNRSKVGASTVKSMTSVAQAQSRERADVEKIDSDDRMASMPQLDTNCCAIAFF